MTMETTQEKLLAKPMRVSHLGLGVELLERRAPGEVELRESVDHRLKVHASAPVRGSCSHQRFVYTRGDIDILPAGGAERWVEHDAGVSILLRLSPVLLSRAAEELGLSRDRVGLAVRHQLRDPLIEHIGWALEAERSAGFPNGLLFSESMGLSLALHLLGRYPVPVARRRKLSLQKLRLLTDYIEANLNGDLSLLQLAGVAGLSASHLKPLFKSSLGMGVHQYVVQRRVMRAKELLLRGRSSTASIALELGFSHQSHMARCMRRVLGVTPHASSRPARARTRCARRADADLDASRRS
jgi:AraC family transcriptional regulator